MAQRILRGSYHRFDSASGIVDFCRECYPTADVRTGNIDGEFVLVVSGPTVLFESLIVHFEGEGVYAVMLPADLPVVRHHRENSEADRRAHEEDTARHPIVIDSTEPAKPKPTLLQRVRARLGITSP
jgi:hypothetical protein